MKTFLLSVLILVSFSMNTQAAPEVKRLAPTSQGQIDLDLLGQALSNQLQTNVHVYRIYASLNPANTVVGMLSEFKNYSVVMKVNNWDFAWCTLTLMSHEKKALVVNCVSPNISIDVPGFISYQEIGLSSRPAGQ